MKGARSVAAVFAVGVAFGVPSPTHAAPTIVHFTDVTAASGIDVTGLGNASSWIDYDRDGDQDLFATNSGFPGQVWLYRNDGGTFTDVTAAAGFGGESIRSVAWGDEDDDGWPDLAATTYASNSRTELFHNDGDGTFSRTLLRKAGIPWRVSWADYDRDGFLDLYQSNASADFLYHNNGDGTFAEVAAAAGVSNTQFSNDGAWADFDGDGWPDLFVADDGADHLYRNDGDGTFTDVTLSAGVSDPSESQAACWGDADSDGRPDLYVVDIDANHNHLYRNDGDGTFADVTLTAGVGDVGDGRTCAWLDVDNDGRLDLFATDHVHLSRLFHNNGNGTFTDIAGPAGIAQPFDVFDAGWADYDGDGDLDAFVVGHAGNVLYRNDGPVGGWLEVDLVGVASNGSAIGATVTLKAPRTRPNRTVEGSSGAYGQNSLTLEFGLGSLPGPFTLAVRWPSGATQTVSGIAPNQHLVITEPTRRKGA